MNFLANILCIINLILASKYDGKKACKNYKQFQDLDYTFSHENSFLEDVNIVKFFRKNPEFFYMLQQIDEMIFKQVTLINVLKGHIGFLKANDKIQRGYSGNNSRNRNIKKFKLRKNKVF